MSNIGRYVPPGATVDWGTLIAELGPLQTALIALQAGLLTLPGSRIIAIGSCTLIATPNGGGHADFSLSEVETNGMTFAAPVDHAPSPYVEIPFTFPTAIPDADHAGFMSAHFPKPAIGSPIPFIAVLPGGAGVQLAFGMYDAETGPGPYSLAVNYDPSAFPLAGVGSCEFHFMLMQAKGYTP